MGDFWDDSSACNALSAGAGTAMSARPGNSVFGFEGYFAKSARVGISVFGLLVVGPSSATSRRPGNSVFGLLVLGTIKCDRSGVVSASVAVGVSDVSRTGPRIAPLGRLMARAASPTHGASASMTCNVVW